MSETIEDIISEMRDEVRTSRENNPDPKTRIFLSTSNMAIEDFADRIDAANTREIEAKDAEIAMLRKIVNELADALNIAREARPDLVIIDDPCDLESAREVAK